MTGSIEERINAKYKKQVIFRAKNAPHRPKYKIPFSSVMLNRLTAGGITVPRMASLYGPSSVYKSTGIYDLIANAQKLQRKAPKLTGGRKIALIDAERSLSEIHLKNCGVDIDDADFHIIDNFDSADELIDIAVDLMISDEYMLVSLDSLTALITEREQDTDMNAMIKLQGWQGLEAACRRLKTDLRDVAGGYDAMNEARALESAFGAEAYAVG